MYIHRYIYMYIYIHIYTLSTAMIKFFSFSDLRNGASRFRLNVISDGFDSFFWDLHAVRNCPPPKKFSKLSKILLKI